MRRGYVLPQENFCSDKARGSETNCTGRARRWAAPRDDISEHNEKATAGNTSRIVKGTDKIMGGIALIGSYTYKKFIPKDIKTLGADEKSAHPAVIFRADFCTDGAGNTLAVLSSRTHKKVFT